MKRFVLIALATATLLSSCAHSPRTEGTYPVMDLHSDILLRAIDHGVDIGNAPAWTQVNLQTMEQGNVRDQVLAVWVNSRGVDGLPATRRALQMMDIFEEQAARYSDRMALATTVADSDRIRESGRIAVWLWLEGGAPIADDLALLRTFYRLGVRGMTLTWTNNLLWAGSSSDRDDDQKGLNEFGREVVQEMNRLGMIIDVSHVSERTFFDVIELSTDPVVASHSACRALCDHDRNLTDDQLRAIGRNGGVVGIAVFPTFLKDDWNAEMPAAEASIAAELETLLTQYDGDARNPFYREARRKMIQAAMPPESLVTIDDFIDHIEHAIRIAGRDHVAIGSDFDGISSFPVGLEKASDWPKVVEAMRARGFDRDTINAVMSENARRVFRQVTDR